MSKAGDIAKVSAKGSFHVLWGLVVSTIIASVGTIFIARLLGSDLYGLYTVVLTVPAIIQIFRDWGINFAMIKFTAQYRAEGRIDEIRSVYLTGLLFEVIVGLALSIFSFFFAGFLATSVFNRPEIAPLIQIISLSIFAGGLVSAATAAFTGYERLELNSVMLICQSFFKTGIIIALVVIGLGTAGATIGFTVGTFIAGLIGVALIGVIYRQLPKPVSHKRELKAYLKTMLTYCLPLSFATIITSLLPQFYAFLLPIHYISDNIPIGNYGVAVNFICSCRLLCNADLHNDVSRFLQIRPSKRQKFPQKHFPVLSKIWIPPCRAHNRFGNMLIGASSRNPFRKHLQHRCALSCPFCNPILVYGVWKPKFVCTLERARSNKLRLKNGCVDWFHWFSFGVYFGYELWCLRPYCNNFGGECTELDFGVTFCSENF